MPKKPKFRPEITRVKLNPEQAVLSCSCDTIGSGAGGLNFYYNPDYGAEQCYYKWVGEVPICGPYYDGSWANDAVRPSGAYS
jgi:hypothetical protein